MKGLPIQQPQRQQVAAEENMSNLTSASGEASGSSGNRNENGSIYPPQQHYHHSQPTSSQTQSQPVKRKRNLPGNPDPDADVIALSPKTLVTKNRYVCEICNKGFQRDQNLQLHRRGHNLPWKLKQRTNKEVRKKVYVCPEPSCVHHDPSRALGDLTGIKKHFFRKHGEKKWKCDKCSKRYAVQSDWKAHSKTCGTKEYRCDCGTLFSRRDSFITHRAFCDALAEESARAITGNNTNNPLLITSQAQPPQGSSSSTPHNINLHHQLLSHHQTQFDPFSLKKEPQTFGLRPEFPPWLAFPTPSPQGQVADLSSSASLFSTRFDHHHEEFRDGHEGRNPNPSLGQSSDIQDYLPATASPHISATALLQKAAQMGATISSKATAGAPAVLHGAHQTHHVSVEANNNNSNSNNATTGFTLNLSSRDGLASGFLASYGNKAAVGGTVAAAAGITGPSSSNLLHDMMTSFSSPPPPPTGGFEGSAFEDAFGGFLNPIKKDDTTLSTTSSHLFSQADESGSSSGGRGGGGNDGMTRDFFFGSKTFFS